VKQFERIIYERVKRYTRLKKALVDTYQLVFSLLLPAKSSTLFPIQIREGFFYGFHDKSPWSLDNTMLLAHKCCDPLRTPREDESVEVGYFVGDEYERFISVGETHCWNWQMGSMLQWVGKTTKIIFNEYNGNRHISRILDKEGHELKRFPIPVATLSSNGKWAVSHSFARLRSLAPAYGYANGMDQEENNPIPEEEGLTLLNLESGEKRFLFSVAEIASVAPEPSMKQGRHYFTHCLFSPSGKRFLFYHRWVLSNGQTWTRMISCNRDGSELFIFPTAGTVTHVAWKNDSTILAYAYTREYGGSYYLFRDQSNDFDIFGEGNFSSDGHPQFSPDGKRVITDSYPNRRRVQYLILYDLEEDKRRDLAVLRSPWKYRHDVRCDLHPRWDRRGTQVCFDSAHTGMRSLCTMKLDQD
jgi:hypothetical protein|tara:strand:- start:2468 stop:3709 length:1242 start_codon:yes stop_codon:yes gene_type:complete